mgnify:CR=1 FL=1
MKVIDYPTSTHLTQLTGGTNNMKRDLFLTDKTITSNNDNIIIEEKHFDNHNSCTAVRLSSHSAMVMIEYNDFDDVEKSHYYSIIVDNENILKIAELIKQKGQAIEL